MSEHHSSEPTPSLPPRSDHLSDTDQSVPYGSDDVQSDPDITKTEGIYLATSEGQRSDYFGGDEPLLETELSDPPESQSDFVIPDSELDRDDRINNVINAILANGMTLREFLRTFRLSGSALINPLGHPSQRQIVRRTLDAINYMQSQNLHADEFILALLDCHNQALWPHQRSLRGAEPYNRRVINGIFNGLRNQICAAGNEDEIWRDLIQHEADSPSSHFGQANDLQINVLCDHVMS
ncbi:uncharacterized protein MELLADRAFT_114351 [Melampsora larici-populina 98AG31]|uniref:Uncharacterized protein n=1 Tax=Melampsora larici-populina (strain 98AG31 / pathotype 3-4-7) TaxID=747676 RepID=F4SD54_MELLP|nr:uncharacterized protein MELLADRAFT_114351 [Melampsora larici-populina 98AG31]EGF97426.1 hypothetical protein MELLADRAFT_114351 [Melampsora larici-populina 98AG31]